MIVAVSEVSMAAESDRAQLGVGGGGRSKGASKQRRIGIWSEPVEGRGSDHSEKYGDRRGQAKARSRTPGRPTSDMENRVKTPGVLRRENPRSVALSKYGDVVAISSSLKTLRGSDVGWWIFRSPKVRVGRGLEGKIKSGGTERVLLERPLVL